MAAGVHHLAQKQRKCGAGRRRGRELEVTRFVAHAHMGRGFRLWPVWWDEMVMVGMAQGNTLKRSELDAPGYCDYIVTSIIAVPKALGRVSSDGSERLVSEAVDDSGEAISGRPSRTIGLGYASCRRCREVLERRMVVKLETQLGEVMYARFPAIPTSARAEQGGSRSSLTLSFAILRQHSSPLLVFLGAQLFATWCLAA